MADFTMDWSEGKLEGERILKLTGPFTLSDVFEFQEVIRTHHPPITIIDLTDVPYMDSAALGSLMGLHVSCQTHNRKYGLVGVCDRLKTLFRVSGVNSVLSTYPTVSDAEASIGGNVATV